MSIVEIDLNVVVAARPNLEMWTIFDSPLDFPGKFVLRKFTAIDGELVPSPDAQTADTLSEISKLVPFGLVCFSRHFNDEPQIVEVWF